MVGTKRYVVRPGAHRGGIKGRTAASREEKMRAVRVWRLGILHGKSQPRAAEPTKRSVETLRRWERELEEYFAEHGTWPAAGYRRFESVIAKTHPHLVPQKGVSTMLEVIANACTAIEELQAEVEELRAEKEPRNRNAHR